MALENYRPIQYPEKTELDNTDFALIDSAETGTHKYQLSRVPAEAEAKVAAAVAVEAQARQAADEALQTDIDTRATSAELAAETTAREAAVTELKNDLTHLQEEIDEFSGGLTPEIKQALLNCFAHVGWDHGVDKSYYEALEEALYADNVKSVSAVFTPGTHEVYPTDSIESLRLFLVVTVTYNDDTQAVVSDYTLEGDISTTGTKTVTVKYGRTKTTTFTVTVVTNSTGLLYEWDFTKSLVDTRQMQEAVLSHYTGSSMPSRNSNGIVFDNFGQQAMLLKGVEITQLKNKTIQVDVASLDAQGSTNAHVRFIMFNQGAGFIYKRNEGWNVYTGSVWGSVFSGMTNRNMISEKRVAFYLSDSLTSKLYLDGTLKGSQSTAFVSSLKNLAIGSDDKAESGGSFYNAVVTGVRIYNGEVA